jgi:hypothetical protein
MTGSNKVSHAFTKRNSLCRQIHPVSAFIVLIIFTLYSCSSKIPDPESTLNNLNDSLVHQHDISDQAEFAREICKKQSHLYDSTYFSFSADTFEYRVEVKDRIMITTSTGLCYFEILHKYEFTEMAQVGRVWWNRSLKRIFPSLKAG